MYVLQNVTLSLYSLAVASEDEEIQEKAKPKTKSKKKTTKKEPKLSVSVECDFYIFPALDAETLIRRVYSFVCICCPSVMWLGSVISKSWVSDNLPQLD